MKKYYIREVLTPAITLVFLLLYVLETLKLSKPVVDGVTQESFFPLILVIVGVIAALSLLISAVKKVNAGEMDINEERGLLINRKLLFVILATAAMIFLFNILGFAIVGPIYIFVLMLIYDDKPQDIVKKGIFAILIAVFVFSVYTYIFEISFPQIWR